MKKLICIAIAAALILTMCGCSKKQSIDVGKAKNAALETEFTYEGMKSTLADLVMDVDDEELLKAVYGLDLESAEEFAVLAPKMNVKASMVVILTPKDGQKETAKAMMNDMLEQYQKQWDSYLPGEAELVRNRLETEAGGALIYIISPDNEAVLKSIKTAVK